jgi:MFS family permease
MMLGWPLASALSGRLLVRFGYRRMVRVGGILVALSSGVFLFPLEAGSGPWLLRLNAFVLGLGLGFANTAAVIAVQESVARAQRGVATAALLFSRTIGAALSAGALGALLATAIGDHVPPGALDELLAAVSRGASFTPSPTLSTALDNAMHTLFSAVIALSVVAWLATLAFPKHSRRPTPG